MVAKKVRAIEKKLKRISQIEAGVARGESVNEQQALLLSKKQLLVATLSEHKSLQEAFASIAEQVRGVHGLCARGGAWCATCGRPCGVERERDCGHAAR